MDLNQYQDLADRTMNRTMPHKDQIMNGVLGLTGEAGEAADLVKKHLFHGHDLDRDRLVKELGDVMWYAATLARTLGVSLEEIAQINLDKLATRYPDGFDEERSKNRNDELTQPQPDPTPECEDLIYTWDLAVEWLLDEKQGFAANKLNRPYAPRIADLARQRDQFGARKYGTRLQPCNGRDHTADALQEHLDAIVYHTNAIWEHENLGPDDDSNNLRSIELHKLARRHAASSVRWCLMLSR